MAWLGRLFLLSYPGEDNDVHGGKEPRSAQVAELLPTLMSQPKFGTSRPPALALICTQDRSGFANGMQPPSVAQYGILSVKIVISIRALSGIVERPHRSEHELLSKAILPVASSTQRIGGCTRQSRYIANRARPTHSASTMQ